MNTFFANYINQAGFIPSGDIRDNTAKILYLFSYCTRTQTPVAALSVDTEKVFDILELSYLESILKNMNYGPCFLRIFRAFMLTLKEIYI